MKKNYSAEDRLKMSVAKQRNHGVKGSENGSIGTRTVAITITISVIIILAALFATLYFTGVFDRFGIDKNHGGSSDVREEEGFKDYRFNAASLPVGDYAKFTFYSGGTEYSFEVYLFSEYAPNTVENFKSHVLLAYYTDTELLADEGGGGILRGGAYCRYPDGKLARKVPLKATSAIDGEFLYNNYQGNILSHTEGVLSMYHGKNNNDATTEFFFCSQDQTSLNGKYAAFGKITTPKGVSTLKKLNSLLASGETVTLKKITLSKKTN